jgi:hypothetical protein
LAAGSEAVVMESGAFTAILKDFEAGLEFASKHWIVKVLVPVTVGVPEITPELEFIESPCGREPDRTVQE